MSTPIASRRHTNAVAFVRLNATRRNVARIGPSWIANAA